MSDPIRVARRESKDERCALCHDAIGADPRVCEGCGSVAHPGCRDSLGWCPTLGCVQGRKPGAHPPGEVRAPVRSLFPDSPELPRVALDVPIEAGEIVVPALVSFVFCTLAMMFLRHEGLSDLTLPPALALGVPLALIAHVLVLPTWVAAKARGAGLAAGVFALQLLLAGVALAAEGLSHGNEVLPVLTEPLLVCWLTLALARRLRRRP